MWAHHLCGNAAAFEHVVNRVLLEIFVLQLIHELRCGALSGCLAGSVPRYRRELLPIRTFVISAHQPDRVDSSKHMRYVAFKRLSAFREADQDMGMKGACRNKKL